MKYISAISWCFLITLSLFFTACSSTGSVAENSDSDRSKSSLTYPSWYNASQALTSSASSYQAFGSAVAADSMAALSRATDQADNNLESGISSKLESNRADAVVELGSGSGLDSPRFIVVLRKAENEVSDVSEASNVVVKKNDANVYRAFVKVEAGKSELIDELDRRFSGYAKPWNAMKNSDAFSDF
ncbi:MAG: hypothetical protein U5J95_04785 [Balneolaceae bacterium]|nr:hypothetical protein [Balneolaceae bacterium]